MRKIINSRISSLWASVVVAAAIYAGPTAAWAKDHAGTGDAVKVVSSTSFDGQPASDMTLEEKNGMSFLRVVFAPGQETQFIDVTRPEGGLPASSSGSGEKHTQLDNNLAMVRIASAASPSQSSSQEFSLWDISRPGHPRLVQKFSDVRRSISSPGQRVQSDSSKR
jgi:hypothetical protein